MMINLQALLPLASLIKGKDSEKVKTIAEGVAAVLSGTAESVDVTATVTSDTLKQLATTACDSCQVRALVKEMMAR